MRHVSYMNHEPEKPRFGHQKLYREKGCSLRWPLENVVRACVRTYVLFVYVHSMQLEYDVRGQEAALLSVLIIAVASAEGGGRVSVSTRVRLVFLLL